MSCVVVVCAMSAGCVSNVLRASTLEPLRRSSKVDRPPSRAADILIVSDSHASNPLAPHRSIANSTVAGERLTHVAVRPPQMDEWGPEVLAWILQRNPGLVLHLGDVSNVACTNEFDRFLAVMEASRRPWVLAPGNHDAFMMGNYAAESALASGWAMECSRGERGDETMNKHRLLLRYLDAQHLGAEHLGSGCTEWAAAPAGNPPPRRGLERVRACFDADAPHRSYLLQQVWVSEALRVLVIDTVVYDAPPAFLHEAGTQGGLGPDQPFALAQWIDELRARPSPPSILLAGHYALDHLDVASQRALAVVFARYPVLGYLSGHEHDPTKELLHPDPAAPDHTFPELNLGSVLDWPMEYARAWFGGGAETRQLTFEVVSAASELGTDHESRCDDADTPASPGTSWRAPDRADPNPDGYTAYVPSLFHSVFYFLGNPAYRMAYARMYDRRKERLREASTSELARYDRCQVRWASQKESLTRLGPGGKEIKWKAPTRATVVRSPERSHQVLEWTWAR
jgi:3',5'-cyclic AMP phosphodiesterase CpdA